jgi:hypothetical protein
VSHSHAARFRGLPRAFWHGCLVSAISTGLVCTYGFLGQHALPSLQQACCCLQQSGTSAALTLAPQSITMNTAASTALVSFRIGLPQKKPKGKTKVTAQPSVCEAAGRRAKIFLVD